MLDGLLGVFAPRTCMACADPLRRTRGFDARWFCTNCCAELYLQPCVFEPMGLRVWAAGPYSGALAQAIRRFKFEDRAPHARRFALLLKQLGAVEHILEAAGGRSPTAQTVLVPVPLHPLRLAERGYNQSALLARYLASEVEARRRLRGLSRLGNTRQQARLDRSERLENIQQQFRARVRFDDETVILIDDVVTTGATALGCATALQAAGAHVAGVIAIAHNA